MSAESSKTLLKRMPESLSSTPALLDTRHHRTGAPAALTTSPGACTPPSRKRSAAMRVTPVRTPATPAPKKKAPSASPAVAAPAAPSHSAPPARAASRTDERQVTDTPLPSRKRPVPTAHVTPTRVALSPKRRAPPGRTAAEVRPPHEPAPAPKRGQKRAKPGTPGSPVSATKGLKKKPQKKKLRRETVVELELSLSSSSSSLVQTHESALSLDEAVT